MDNFVDDTGLMRCAMRTAVATATVGVTALLAGCSTASDPVDSASWRRVDAAERAVYGAMGSPTETATSAKMLHDRLSEAVDFWDGAKEPAYFTEAEGAAVIYDYREDPSESVFNVFVASGLSERTSPWGWYDRTPGPVYTCYRLEVSFEYGVLSNFMRASDFDEDRLECPQDLVDALGDGAQYREPWMFDG